MHSTSCIDVYASCYHNTCPVYINVYIQSKHTVWCFVRMEDNECFVKYIEIVPLDNINNCSDVTDIKQEPDIVVKVCVSYLFMY